MSCSGSHPGLTINIKNKKFVKDRKKIFRVYNGLAKKIAIRNVRIKYQSYIFFNPLSMFHLLGEFKNHLSLFIFLFPKNLVLFDMNAKLYLGTND
jgi:hypothetical protein